MLPTDSNARKNLPLARGVLDYFPDAVAAVAALSQAGNDKHNPGEPLHWSREKSSDHADCIVRHLVERGAVDPDDGFLHDVKVAWRALALCQLAIEKQREKDAKPKWVDHDGRHYPVDAGRRVSVRLRNNIDVHGGVAESFRWLWAFVPKHESDVVAYYIPKD